MRGKRGQVRLDVPKVRESSLQTQLVQKGHSRLDGLAVQVR